MNGRAISRRVLLASMLGPAACRRKQPSGDRKTHLRFSTWGAEVEINAFRGIIRQYEALRPKVAIDLEEISYRTLSSIDVELAAGVGPDLFRVEYTNVGRYCPSGAIINLSPYIPKTLVNEFTAPVWTAVQYNGNPYALPHQTDTSAILYNKAIFKRLGIRAPQTLNESWTWQEFIDVSEALKRVCPYAFAVNWTFDGSFRWLNFLYQRGGALLKDDFKTSAILSPQALDTLRWTQSFFSKGLVPLSDSAKSTEQIESLFGAGIVGMYFDVGPQGMQELGSTMDWGTTFLPQDVRRASELGGNAIAVTRDCRHPEIAADFALFLTNEKNMREFVLATDLLPVRRTLLCQNLPYRYKPEEMRIHLEQSTTVPVGLARTVTLPRFPRIARVLGDELDRSFTGGQSAEAALEHLDRAIRRAMEAA